MYVIIFSFFRISSFYLDGNSTCSILNNNIRHHLIISTTNSLRSNNSSGFSPRTISTIYQSDANPYLVAVSNDVTNVVSFKYEIFFFDT
jgi:hypothetical protein